MVLETIDTIGGEHQLDTNAPKPEDLLSPVTEAGTPRSIIDSRDAAVATPCDSIRMYANELAASKSNLSVSKEDGSSGAPMAILVPTTDTEQRDEPAADAVEEEEEDRADEDVAPSTEVPSAGAKMISVRSELSCASGMEGRVTHITVSGSDENKSVEESKAEEESVKQPTSLQPADSVEVHLEELVKPAAVEEEEAAKPEAVAEEEEEDTLVEDEAKSEAVEEETAKPAEEGEVNPVEEEIATAESKAESIKSIKPALSIDLDHVEKEQVQAETTVEKKEEPALPAATATATATSTPAKKKSKFGLKLSKKSPLPPLSKKPLSPRASSSKKSLSKGLSKANLSKPSISKPNLSKRFGKSLGKKSKKAADSKSAPATPAAEEEDAKKEEEPKMETIDLDNNDGENKPADNACSAFFIEQNSTMQVKEAEILDAAQEANEDDEESLPEVQVEGEPQVTELVTKAPEAEAAEAADAAGAASADPKETEEQPNIMEVLYERAEDCFAFESLCGPKSKNIFGKKNKGKDADDSTVDGDASVKSGKSSENNKKPAAIDTATDNEESAFQLPENLMTPLSIATHRATSFVDELSHNESIKSIIDNLTTGFNAAANQAEKVMFPEASTTLAETPASPEKLKQEKLDKAASAAKKALDEAGDGVEEESLTGKSRAGSIVGSIAGKKMFFGRSSEKNEKKVEAKKEADAKKVEAKKEADAKKAEAKKEADEKKADAKKEADAKKAEAKEEKKSLKIFAPKPAAAEKPAAAAAQKPAAPKASKTPTSPSRLSLLKRGLSKRTASGATTAKSPGKSASNMKKITQSSFRRLKKPSGIGGSSKKKSKGLLTMSSPKKNKAAAADAETSVDSQDIQQNLVGSTSMNSQSLNEHQVASTSIAEETPTPMEETETPKVEEETSDDGAAVEEEPPKQEDEAPVAAAQEETAAVEEEPAAAPAAVDEPAAEELSEPAAAAEEEEPKTEETPAVEETKVEEETTSVAAEDDAKVEETSAPSTTEEESVAKTEIEEPKSEASTPAEEQTAEAPSPW